MIVSKGGGNGRAWLRTLRTENREELNFSGGDSTIFSEVQVIYVQTIVMQSISSFKGVPNAPIRTSP